jgi:hypothetical protein
VVFKQGAWASRETRDFPEIRCKIVWGGLDSIS